MDLKFCTYFLALLLGSAQANKLWAAPVLRPCQAPALNEGSALYSSVGARVKEERAPHASDGNTSEGEVARQPAPYRHPAGRGHKRGEPPSPFVRALGAAGRPVPPSDARALAAPPPLRPISSLYVFMALLL
jgi:hypothetical protein